MPNNYESISHDLDDLFTPCFLWIFLGGPYIENCAAMKHSPRSNPPSPVPFSLQTNCLVRQPAQR
jgi:hypothetical protein